MRVQVFFMVPVPLIHGILEMEPLLFPGKLSITLSVRLETYSVQLTVTNSLSQTDQVTKSIVIEPDDNPPFLVTEQKFSVIQGKTVILNLKTAQDFDSTSLTYSVVSKPFTGNPVKLFLFKQ